MDRLARLRVALATAICLLFVAGLRDVPSRRAPVTTLVAPPVPREIASRDAAIVVTVSARGAGPVAGAVVQALWLDDDVAYLAGTASTDASGRAKLSGLPRGETWLVARADGMSRASTRVVLEAGTRELSLSVVTARTLDALVVDDGGAPIAGASLLVRTGDPLPYPCTSDAAGRASCGRLGPAPWIVDASAAGYETVRRDVGAGERPPVRIALRKLGAIDVQVLDASGAAAKGATVVAAGTGLWPARRASADETGRVRLEGLARGVYDLRAVRGDEVAPTEVGFPLGRGESKAVTLGLVRGRRFSVRVVDGEGPDARGVAASSVVLAESGISPFPLEATSDAEGRAALGPVAPGDVALSARAEGFVAKTGVVVRAADATSVTIALVRGATLIGEVVDARGDPIGGAAIEIVGSDPAGQPIDETAERNAIRDAHFSWALAGPRELVPAGQLGVMRGPIPAIPHAGFALAAGGLLRPAAPGSGAKPPPEPWVSRDDGRFRATPVTPGRVRAIVRHPGYVEGLSDAVTLAPGGEARVKVVLHGGGALEGRVLDDRRHPVAGARVDLVALRGTLERTTRTADDGTFGFAAVPGEVAVSVARPESPDDLVLRTAVAVPEGATKKLEIVLPPPRDAVRVHVVDERGRALDDAQVTALSLSPDAPLRATAFTTKDGDATVRGALGLPLRLEVTLPGRAPEIREVAAATAEIVITLTPGLRVEGRVTTRHGHDDLEGADVTLRAGTATRHARSAKDGSFALVDAPRGPAHLVVAHAGYAPVEKQVELVEARADRPATLEPVDLSSGGAVEGIVEDARGKPVAGARVAKDAVPAWLPAGKLPAGIATTDGEGAFRLVDLPEGEVAIEAYAPDVGRAKITGVVVRAERTTARVRLRLAEGAGSAEPAASGGVAITLGERGAGDALEVVVVSVTPGGEAERAGVAPGDRVVAVDGAAPTSMGDARSRLAGPLGADVLVEVEREGQRKRLRVARERVVR